ncbi:MAG: methionyl-tRNA formyltransferase [Chthoniobacterales bacterium]
MRVVFIGTGDIGVPVLRWLIDSREHELVGVVTQPDKPVGREQRILPTPIKAALGVFPAPVLQPKRIKSEEAIAEIRALQSEVAVVMAYGQILPRAVLDIPTVACLNLHASLLPRHRGAAPIQSAIAAGDPESGLTVMYMDEGLDTGDILLESRLALAPNETGGSLHNRLSEMAPTALAEALALLAAGNAPRQAQDSGAATYAPKLEREHGRVDWSEPVEVTERKIRAFNPWPGSYVILRNANGREAKLKIFSSSLAGLTNLASGQLAASSADGLLIGAASGALRLDQVQLEGKKRMSGADFIRGQEWIASATVIPRPPASS